jgi:uncharacterized membrane protein (UPF0127 family)
VTWRRVLRWYLWTMGIGTLALIVMAVLAAEPDPATRDTNTTTTTIVEATTATSPAANDLGSFTRRDIDLGGESWTVAVADTAVLRAQGLMGVTDLTVDGMLFVFEAEREVAFYMKNTLIPLDIAFFADDGSLVDQFTMTPCEADPCPTYPAAGPVRYAIETAVGGFAGIDPLVLRVASSQ